MRIESSTLTLSSTRAYASRHQIDERLRAWEGNRRPDFEAIEKGGDTIHFSERARSAATASIESAIASEPTDKPDALAPQDEARIYLLEKLFEQVTGKKIKLRILRVDEPGADPKTAEALSQIAGSGNAPAGWGVEYDRIEHVEEAEQTSFSARGRVQTADGKQIEIALDLTMSRQYEAHNEAHLRLGDAVRKDPLVINLDGNAAQLTTNKFRFDLDADGAEDQISFLKPGAGFLAIDQNHDGKINNGSELFGPATGDGFSELAAHDADGNEWIDEADPVFNQLRIWTKNAEGKDQLTSLGKAGIGALYLGNARTEFSVNDAANQQLGQVQSTGIWLGERDGAGTLQHLDLVV